MSPESLTKTRTASPLVIIGMPRCGSTIFTRLLNESPDLLIINDFYYLQYVDAIGGFSNHDRQNKDLCAKYVAKWLIKRIKRPSSTGIGCGLMISPEEEAKIKDFLADFDPDGERDWGSILEEIMSFSAKSAGAKIWGHNTPQDYLNLDLIDRRFPQSQFIFMIRNPQSMLCSYKFIIKSKASNDDSIRYHPVLQTLAWRTAVRAFLDYQKRNPNRILSVRYEDLIAQTNQTLAKVGEFTKADFPPLNLDDFGNNSSFKDKKRKTLNDTEMWLCEKIAGREMEQLEYSLSGKKPRLRDLGNLVFVSLKVFWHYSISIFTSVDTRKRVWKLAKKILLNDRS